MKTSIILVVENIRSLHNIGSLFRTADAVNIEKIVLSSLCAVPPRHEIDKTALGATSTVGWEQVADLKKYLENLAGYTIVSLEQTSISTDLFTTKISGPIALIIGHEREGVSQELLECSNYHIHIPMKGTSAHSLNVSNAAAVALYHLGSRFWYDTDI